MFVAILIFQFFLSFARRFIENPTILQFPTKEQKCPNGIHSCVAPPKIIVTPPEIIRFPDIDSWTFTHLFEAANSLSHIIANC